MPEKNPVGARIRQLREARSLSVQELAAQSSISQALLESLEVGDLVPSLSPLIKISRALGVRLGTLLDDRSVSGPVVVRANDPAPVVRFSGSVADARKSALDFFSLAPNKHDRHMEPFLIDVHPADAVGAPSSHEGEEFIFVLAGTVEIAYGAEVHVLRQNESIYYDSVIPHRVRSADGAEARILAVVFTPC
ncbi:MAG: XRE family transcriptional regulator [Lentisphaeria bacterium]|jgi:transcriptional regulator with XRE-family HTH domain|nr:XRE family transcriptional regulator [Lentisphaeria bacterium]